MASLKEHAYGHIEAILYKNGATFSNSPRIGFCGVAILGHGPKYTVPAVARVPREPKRNPGYMHFSPIAMTAVNDTHRLIQLRNFHSIFWP